MVSESEQPKLVLAKTPMSLDDIVKLFKALTGRDPSPEEIQRVKDRRAARGQHA